MKRLLNISVFAALIYYLIPVAYSQNDFSKTGISFKIYGAPQFFAQSNCKAPMPVAGFAAAFVFNTTEIEFGFQYVPKFLAPSAGTGNYRAIFYTHHYLNPTIHIHQKLYAMNNHILSVSLGGTIVQHISNPADTLELDGSHRVNWHPTGSQAINIGLYLHTGFHYSYRIGKRISFFVSPSFNFKLVNEYHIPNSPLGAPSANDTYVPQTDPFAFGLNVGFHFIIPFSKEGPGFFEDNNRLLNQSK